MHAYRRIFDIPYRLASSRKYFFRNLVSILRMRQIWKNRKTYLNLFYFRTSNRTIKLVPCAIDNLLNQCTVCFTCTLGLFEFILRPWKKMPYIDGLTISLIWWPIQSYYNKKVALSREIQPNEPNLKRDVPFAFIKDSLIMNRLAVTSTLFCTRLSMHVHF